MHRGHVVSSALACLLLLPFSAGAAIIHVPADQPTIEAAIDAAQSGDTILVANGTYTGPGNRDIVIRNKGIQLASEGGSSHCVIDLQGHSGIKIGDYQDDDTNRSNLLIDGFTMRNAGVNGALYVDGFSEMSASNCMFVENDGISGGGIHVEFGCIVFADRCTFVRNRATAFFAQGDSYISRCAFYGNRQGAIEGEFLHDNSEHLSAQTCLFVGNSDAMTVFAIAPSSFPTMRAYDDTVIDNDAGIGAYIIVGSVVQSGEILNSLIWNSPPPDTGPDPMLVRNPSPGPDGVWGTPDDDYGDLHLRPGSPAVDTGEYSFNSVDFDGNPRIVGPAIDLGAYELQGARLLAEVVSVRQSTTRYGVTVRLVNTGNDNATVIKVLTATLNGSSPTPPLPMTLNVTLPPGSWVDVFVGFPKSVGTHGQPAVFDMTGSYKSGTVLFPLGHSEDVTLP